MNNSVLWVWNPSHVIFGINNAFVGSNWILFLSLFMHVPCFAPCMMKIQSYWQLSTIFYVPCYGIMLTSNSSIFIHDALLVITIIGCVNDVHFPHSFIGCLVVWFHNKIWHLLASIDVPLPLLDWLHVSSKVNFSGLFAIFWLSLSLKCMLCNTYAIH